MAVVESVSHSLTDSVCDCVQCAFLFYKMLVMVMLIARLPSYLYTVYTNTYGRHGVFWSNMCMVTVVISRN